MVSKSVHVPWVVVLIELTWQSFAVARGEGGGLVSAVVGAGRHVKATKRRARRRRRRRRVDDAVARSVGFAADAGGVAVAPHDAAFVDADDAFAVVKNPDDVASVLDAMAVGSAPST